ncbi:xanthine dehydrogenase family protein molybdopterin-binding subunit [Ferroplasma acidiphilum]|uniref:Xanthine dehydrogenase family protein molybdopterin-binding subunit n=1 Tax=Ferroplasma acidiphilum TaxID=74969 RepID=A0A7K4FMW5_9ARCH|nr:xanthine dehydrogenase family protein molybdopterin-binding subunit [Ferroplasma acidiphilum]NOL60141.1 xanthine dehydrogenase family protein molybdopterin-binding subunit [Ferroplasma acidiphilum]
MDYRDRYVDGKGKYIDDMTFNNMLYMNVFRSPYGKAKIKNVKGGLNASELKLFYKSSMGEMASLGGKSNSAYLEPVFAIDNVNYEGQAIAAVFGKTRYESEDLLNTVSVDYEPMQAVSGIDEALKAPPMHEGTENNILAEAELGEDFDENDIDFDLTIEDTFFNERIIANSMETRGCIADYKDSKLTFYVSTQSVQSVKAGLVQALGLKPEDVRVIQADTGGAFGSKGSFYPEYVMAAYASKKYGKPVKWIETRKEHLEAAYPGRGAKARIKIYARNDGRITGIKGDVYVDAGAYDAGTGGFASRFIAYQITGPYHIEKAYMRAYSMLTNKAPMGPYRGAGRPEAAFFMERMMDLLADRLQMDISEVRLVNASTEPFTSPTGLTVKEATRPFLEKALEEVNYRKISREEKTGIAFFVLIPASRPGESARIDVSNGKITAQLGGNVHGQGHELFVKSILENELQVEQNLISLENGDTAEMEGGVGSWGSRTAIAGASALMKVAGQIKEQVIKKYGKYSPEKLLSGNYSAYDFLKIDYDVNSVNFNMITAERSRGGLVTMKDWYSYYDLGHVLSPVNVIAQITGGVLEGVGQMLSESLRYSPEGQLMTTSISDAGLLTADYAPNCHIKWVENGSPSPSQAKGLGEAPTIGTPAALARAVELVTRNRVVNTPIKLEDIENFQ